MPFPFIARRKNERDKEIEDELIRQIEQITVPVEQLEEQIKKELGEDMDFVILESRPHGRKTRF